MIAALTSLEVDAVLDVCLGEELAPSCSVCDEPVEGRELSEISDAFPDRAPAHLDCGAADVRRYFRRGAP